MGGYNAEDLFFQSTEICSPSSGCTEFVDLPEESFSTQAVRIDQKRIFVLPNDQGHAWIFNQEDNSFQRIPDLTQKRRKPVIGFINGHEVVVAGGVQTRSSEIFDLNINEWRIGPPLPVTYYLESATSVQYQNSFLIVGGRDSFLGYQDSIIKFDPVNYGWQMMPQRLQRKRCEFAAFLVPDDLFQCA